MTKPILRSRQDRFSGTILPSPPFTVDDLLGRTFLLPPNEKTGERHRTKIKRAISLHGDDMPENIGDIEFFVESHGETHDHILTYNEVIDYLNKQQEEPSDHSNPDSVFRFRRITGYEGPLHPPDKQHPTVQVGSTRLRGLPNEHHA